MATSFKILLHRNEDSLHLKLMGDFDVTSVSEIFKVLKNNGRRTSNVFIHTGCLNGIQPNARAVFRDQLQVLHGNSFRLVFTGRFSDALSAKEKSCVKSDLESSPLTYLQNC